MREKRFHFRAAHVLGMTLLVKQDKAPDPGVFCLVPTSARFLTSNGFRSILLTSLPFFGSARRDDRIDPWDLPGADEEDEYGLSHEVFYH